MISDEAKAIQALANELDNLFEKSSEINQKIVDLHSEYTRTIKELSSQHLSLIKKMSAMEDAIDKLQLRTPKLYHEDA